MNPGPFDNSLEIISVNCNGLTSDLRLLQAIGKVKKKIKESAAIILLQETHNANIVLLESIWNGPINVSMGTGGSKGVITLCTKKLVVKSFEADPEGRYLFTTIDLGLNSFLHTMNIYAPNTV